MTFGQAVTATLSDAEQTRPSEHAGSTLSAADRRRLLQRPERDLRRLVTSWALLSIAAVLAGIAALPSIEARLATPVFYYTDSELALAEPGPFRPGQVVPLRVTLCVDDPSAVHDRGGYDLEHGLVAADEPTRLALLAAFVEAEPGPPGRLPLPHTFGFAQTGCASFISTRSVLPTRTPAGSYYLEGFARYGGPTGRSGAAYWKSAPFTVVKGP